MILPALLLGALAAAPDTAAGRWARFAAVVDARFGGAEGDSVGGAPVFRSIGRALDALPVNGAGRAVLLVRKGRYREKLTIDRPRLTLVGEHRDSTVLTFDATADTPSPGGGRYGTRGSFTLRVVAPDFRAERLTVENGFDYMANRRKADADPTKVRNAQGVALMLDGDADRAAFVDVRVLGHQDTLFPNAGRSWFYGSEIAGSVDFIFGAGRAVFDSSVIVSRDRGSRTNNGYVTAGSHPAGSHSAGAAHGFLFWRSRLVKESPAMAPASVTLGRPWHPHADPDAVALVVFAHCWMDDHVGAKGWDRMGMTDSTGRQVQWEPSTARFFEFGTTGPGAVPSPTRRTLSAAEATRHTPAQVLGGWSPSRTLTPIP
jgi:pectinesterase